MIRASIFTPSAQEVREWVAPQFCKWTADCQVQGCANRCVANLLATSAQHHLNDAAWSPSWWEICPRLASIVKIQVDRLSGSEARGNESEPGGAAAPAPAPQRRLQDAAGPGSTAPALQGPVCFLLECMLKPSTRALFRLFLTAHPNCSKQCSYTHRIILLYMLL
jgi:hypothetical protein